MREEGRHSQQPEGIRDNSATMAASRPQDTVPGSGFWSVGTVPEELVASPPSVWGSL